MNVVRYDKVTLIQEYSNLRKIGETYEVANITDTSVVIRDVISKIAIAAIDIDSFDNYFQKTITGWTKWGVLNESDNIIGYYRTNGKKVQVKTINGSRGEASCNKMDNFNLNTGIQIAYNRSYLCWLNKMYKKLTDSISNIDKEMQITRKNIKNLIKKVEPKNNTEEQ